MSLKKGEITASNVQDIDGTDVTTIKTALALENVDNTSDTDKPISTATQTALDGKLSLTGNDAIANPITGDVYFNEDSSLQFFNATDLTSFSIQEASGIFEIIAGALPSDLFTFVYDAFGLTISKTAGTPNSVLRGGSVFDNPNNEDFIQRGNLTIESNPTGVTGADQVTNVISLTQAEYDAITPNASTLYVING